MQTKLTLRLDGSSIENAKAWAQGHGVSLSSVVEQFFRHLPSASRNTSLTPWTRRLGGAGAGGPTDVGESPLREAYLDRLEEKYR